MIRTQDLPLVYEVPFGERLYSTVEVGRMFGIQRRAVTDSIHKGRLPAYRTHGGWMRVRARDLRAALIAAGRTELLDSVPDTAPP